MGIKYFKRAILNKKREEKTWTSRRHLHPKDYFTNDVFRPIFYSPVYHLFHFRFRIQIYQSRKSFRLLNTHMLVQFCYPIFLFNLSIQQKSLSKFIANIYYWAMFVAQLVQRSLPKSEVHGLIPAISKIYIEHLFTVNLTPPIKPKLVRP